MVFIQELIERIRQEDIIFIQTHNFPDHDSVASAFGLQELLKHFNINSHIIYEGEIQRGSISTMCSELGIEINHASYHEINENHLIIIVDGCKGNKNVTDIIGDEIAVIDHHQVTSPEDVPYADIRPDFGACSTIIYSYFRDLNINITRNTATALMIGINMDTALLTRGVSADDIGAYAELYTIADLRLQNSILRNYIQTRDLEFYRYALDNVKINNEIAVCYFESGCNQNLLGILGDFFLALEEVDFVILYAKNNNVINFSLRSERDEWNASVIIQELLKGSGFGGGHKDMAGGIIPDVSHFDPDLIEKKIFQIFNS
jgi:nanoRNase/pAp phosphatase (c-di-AMP/oligoRNAs hydrolase)